ncbi:hypothetical protein FHX59_004950 [Paraburkholderia silvatlantica]|uniref:KTSC domain-containing protein n=1 Tax=Paraburkholderia silvatlantica TaxID=321895 RepID=A0ABR6FSV2_9BURK|nr:hypothetical protein [Paraburkholderia silvatlantica]PVY30295.1 hypothetical protein C7411_11349 [Paraburkholderia silvatlantica]PXW36969.1 hypothetical protein C7413_113162 [Paraburkholderia silvatlantica]
MRTVHVPTISQSPASAYTHVVVLNNYSKEIYGCSTKDIESSGNYYNSQRAYLGQRYIDLAFTRYYQHRFDRGQLAEYLNLKPKNLPTFAEKFAGGGL